MLFNNILVSRLWKCSKYLQCTKVFLRLKSNMKKFDDLNVPNQPNIAGVLYASFSRRMEPLRLWGSSLTRVEIRGHNMWNLCLFRTSKWYVLPSLFILNSRKHFILIIIWCMEFQPKEGIRILKLVLQDLFIGR